MVLHDVLAVTSASINAAVLWLSKKSSELSHNKHGDLLLHEPFFAGQSTEQPQPKDSGVEVQHKVVANAKPSVCVRNVNKKLKRRDAKIKEYKSEISAMSKENEVLHSRLVTAKRASESNRVALSRLNKTVINEKDSQLLKSESHFVVHEKQFTYLNTFTHAYIRGQGSTILHCHGKR